MNESLFYINRKNINISTPKSITTPLTLQRF